MEATKKHTKKVADKKSRRTAKKEVVIITKQSISAKDSLFADKVKKANQLLKGAVLMKH